MLISQENSWGKSPTSLFLLPSRRMEAERASLQLVHRLRTTVHRLSTLRQRCCASKTTTAVRFKKGKKKTTTAVRQANK